MWDTVGKFWDNFYLDSILLLVGEGQSEVDRGHFSILSGEFGELFSISWYFDLCMLTEE